MTPFETHQSAIGRILQVFARVSSSELTLARRSTSIMLLDAVHYVLGISAADFYRNITARDWNAFFAEQRFHPSVMAFFLANGIQPSPGHASTQELECIQCGLQNLINRSVQDAVNNI